MDVEWNNELIQIERRGWEALCSADAEAYYRQHMTEEALMAFPFGVMNRQEALNAMAGALVPLRDRGAERGSARSGFRRRRVLRERPARGPGPVLGGPQ
jgi:hypothetical protein